MQVKGPLNFLFEVLQAKAVANLLSSVPPPPFLLPSFPLFLLLCAVFPLNWSGGADPARATQPSRGGLRGDHPGQARVHGALQLCQRQDRA